MGDYVKIMVVSYKDGYKSVGELMIMNLKIEKRWIMESRCYYHICQGKNIKSSPKNIKSPPKHHEFSSEYQELARSIESSPKV